MRFVAAALLSCLASPPARAPWACKVTVPQRPSPQWPGWSEIASLPGFQVSHGVDGSGAIWLAEWNDGLAVRHEQDGAWHSLETLQRDQVFWTFAVDRAGSPFVARSWLARSGEAASVEVLAWDGTGWNPLGPSFASGHTAEKPALALDDSGRPLLMFGSPSLQAWRWDVARWRHLGGPALFSTGPGSVKSALAFAGNGRLFAIGRHDTSLHAALFNGAVWADLGEMKPDTRDAAVAADAQGRGVIALNEGGHIYATRWTGLEFEGTGDWPGASFRASSGLSLSSVAGGGLWLSWTVPEPSGSKVVIYRWQDTGWRLFDELHSTSAIEGSIVCADDSGNPILMITGAQAGHLLYRHP